MPVSQSSTSVRNHGWVKLPFYPCVTSVSLSTSAPIMNNLFMVQPLNRKSLSGQWEGGIPLFKSRSHHLREHSSTSPRSGKEWIPSCVVMSPASHSVLSPKWKAYWVGVLATLTHANQRTIPHEKEFMTHSGLRLSYLGHRIETVT